MNRPSEEQEAEPGDADAAGKVAAEDSTGSKPDPVRRVTLIVFAVAIALFVWYVAADRLAPWTDQARVQAFVVPVAPEVSGRVINVHVTNNQLVSAGDLLIEIDPTDYELAVADAEADLEQAGQDIGADTEQVSVSQAKLTQAITKLEYTETQATRYLTLAAEGTVSQADADRARAEVKNAKAAVESAKAELQKAKEAAGGDDDSNPRMRAAIATLENARKNLAATKIYAPSDGGITNLQVDVGRYATTGAPVMTFVSTADVWIQANLRENSLEHISRGDRVDILLDHAPGRIFAGEVASRGFAVAQPSTGEVGGLVSIKSDSGWLRSAQRFPVEIRFLDESASRQLRFLGGQADVQIYAADNALLNALGKLWIRTLSIISYVY